MALCCPLCSSDAVVAHVSPARKGPRPDTLSCLACGSVGPLGYVGA